MEEKKYSLPTLYVGLYTDTRVPNECRYMFLKQTPVHQTLQVNEYLKQSCNTDKIYPCFQPIDNESRILIDGLDSNNFFERLSDTKTWTTFTNEHSESLKDILPEEKLYH